MDTVPELNDALANASMDHRRYYRRTGLCPPLSGLFEAKHMIEVGEDSQAHGPRSLAQMSELVVRRSFLRLAKRGMIEHFAKKWFINLLS